MAIRIQLRRGTAAEWTAANPVLATGEQGYETDTGKTKVGDGVTAWASLPYPVDDAAAAAVDANPTIADHETRIATTEAALAIDTAYPTLQEALTAGAGGTVLITTSQTVPGGTTIPASTRVLVSPGVVLTRAQPTTGVWVTVGAGAILDGGKYNGNKANASSFSKANVSVHILAGGTLQNAHVYDGNGHGVRLETGARAINVASDGHGNNPGGSGTGDGFYVGDQTGVLFEDCFASGNARMGFTVTSNTADASATLRRCHADETNGYVPFDFETATGTSVVVVAEDISGGPVAMTGADVTITRSAIGGVSSSPGAHVAITKLVMQDTSVTRTTTSSVMQIYAHTIDLENVRCVAASGTSYAVALYPTTHGRVDGLRLTGTSTYGVALDDNQSVIGVSPWRTVRGVDVSAATITDRRIIIGSRRGYSNSRFEVRERKFVGWANGAPGSVGGDPNWYNTFDVGDVIYALTPIAAGNIGWVCVTAGSPGTWKSFGTIAA